MSTDVVFERHDVFLNLHSYLHLCTCETSSVTAVALFPFIICIQPLGPYVQILQHFNKNANIMVINENKQRQCGMYEFSFM